MTIRPLTRAELPSDTVDLARFLLGKLLIRDNNQARLSGRIVETEAYPPGDPASHAYRGETVRNSAMFLTHGHAYIYRSYGIHNMFNVSSEIAGVGAGVLIRAVEPVQGIAAMQANRPGVATRDLTRGPGRLAAALDIDHSVYGDDLCQPGPLWLACDDHTGYPIRTSTRIGLTKAAGAPLRFYVPGNSFVSGPKALNTLECGQ